MTAPDRVDDVVVGEIARAHGIRGAMRVRATGATLAALGGGEPVILLRRDGVRVPATIADVTGEGQGLILHLREVTDRDAADALRGALIRIPGGRLPATPAGEFYVRDLVGCRVEVVGGRVLGRVARVHPGPANDVLEVVPDADGAGIDTGGDAAEGAAPVLVPFTRDAIPEMDLATRRIVVRAGLLDDDAGA